MLPIPSPLHAAVVHFPIVLVLLGTLTALGAVITRRWNLPLFAAVLLTLGALGAVVAVATGEKEGELVSTAGVIEQLLDRHESWAENTRNFAIAAAVLAMAAAAATRWSRASRALGAATAAVALIAGWCVFQTGHYGGQLVYRHGAGVNLVATSTPDGRSASTARPVRTHDRDD